MVQLGVARTLRTTRSGHEWPMGNILFLSSSPNAAPDGGYAVPEPAVLRVREASDFGPLEVGLEVAEVRGELAGVPGAFRLAHLPNASIVDMIRALAGGRYEVVHFSGHASDRGLVLAGDGNPRYLSAVDLGTLVSLGGRVRLLVLNACCSQTLVGEVAKIADFVITMNERIYDQEARAFSRVLYLLLARGNHWPRRSTGPLWRPKVAASRASLRARTRARTKPFSRVGPLAKARACPAGAIATSGCWTAQAPKSASSSSCCETVWASI